ncbi:MAG TPA: alpha/beta fold hydrolase [Candidatus Sulfotelmatobacter sp.]|jgi:dienelactone hydrolase|nr:alpha/beta fold hydrolase [Candidatus Sulfotelmatobacter sp.]
MGKRFWFAFGTLGVLIITVAYLRQSNFQPAKEISNSIQAVVHKTYSSPQPTPYKFEDLTIPYLRSRTYKSSLGELQQIDKNASYTSYLTSYNSDGLKINGLLTVPTGDAPIGGWPAIVFVHGYIPPKQYATTSRYEEYVDYLTKNGFVVFKIDLRGNGDSQGQPVGAYYSAGYVIDTLNAYAALQSVHSSSISAMPYPTLSVTLSINPKKIGLWGHSMAGNIVMRAWTAKADIPAIVIWSGAGYTYTDLIKYKLNDSSYQLISDASSSANFQFRQQLQKLYGQPDMSNPFWHNIAPANFLTNLKGAIQIDQAQDDTVVNIGYNRDLIKLFDKTSIPHIMYEYPTGGHNISGVYFTTAMQHTVDFYKKYLE